jgi:hypothetical protein
MFLGFTGFGVFTGIQAPILRGLVSKQVGPKEFGLAYGAIATLESIFQLIYPIMMEQGTCEDSTTMI